MTEMVLEAASGEEVGGWLEAGRRGVPGSVLLLKQEVDLGGLPRAPPTLNSFPRNGYSCLPTSIVGKTTTRKIKKYNKVTADRRGLFCHQAVHDNEK